MSTREIRPSTGIQICDVCGRTLLRGERQHVYLDGAARRSVCELCTGRAMDEGWVREGAVPSFEAAESRTDRRRSLFGRFRARRDERSDAGGDASPGSAGSAGSVGSGGSAGSAGSAGSMGSMPPEARGWPDPAERGRGRIREPIREPRHVRAIPTSVEHRTASAVDAFNGSEHPRTVAGVARSLGSPVVAVLPVDGRPGLVHIVVSWELCWYRYEVDLSEAAPTVRVAAQGYELEELPPEEIQPNAVADERGSIRLGE